MNIAELLTPSNITFVVGLLGVVFTVTNYFTKPQIALDKKQALDQAEVDGKAALLSQQIKLNNDATERRFAEMGTRITEAMTLAQNHIHTVDTKVETLNTNVTAMGNSLVRLSTIIDERIPKRVSPGPEAAPQMMLQ